MKTSAISPDFLYSSTAHFKKRYEIYFHHQLKKKSLFILTLNRNTMQVISFQKATVILLKETTGNLNINENK